MQDLKEYIAHFIALDQEEWQVLSNLFTEVITIDALTEIHLFTHNATSNFYT